MLISISIKVKTTTAGNGEEKMVSFLEGNI